MSSGAFPTRAMILAAGLGLRMRPLTETCPKPLVPVAGVPLIDWALDAAARAGVTDAVVNSFHLAEMLEAHLRARARLPHILISREERALETGGGIARALPLLGDAPFFSLNSDVICLDGDKPALRRLAVEWDDARMDALLLLHPAGQAVGYEGPGDFFAQSGVIRRRRDGERAPLVFTGVQLVHPRLFADAPRGPFSMNALYNRGILPDGTLPRIAALMHDGEWLHVGDARGLALAEAHLRRRGQR